MQRFLQPPLQVVVLGQDELAARLERVALGQFLINKSIIRLQTNDLPLPPALAQTIPHLPKQGGSFAVVCSGFTCGLPIQTVDALIQALRR